MLLSISLGLALEGELGAILLRAWADILTDSIGVIWVGSERREARKSHLQLLLFNFGDCAPVYLAYGAARAIAPPSWQISYP
jgi:hypothetical protein